MSVNKVIILGRLGQDPELKYTPSGAGVCNFSLATTESWNDKGSGQKQERTEWHRVVIFNEGLVNVVKQYLKKGAQIYVEGQLTTNKYTDSNGQEKYSTQIVLQGYNSTLKMLGGATGSPQGGVDQSSASSSLPSDDMSSPADLDDEVPF